MLSGIGDGLAEVMTHALDCLSLDMDQGVRMYAAVLKVLRPFERKPREPRTSKN